MIRKTLGTIFIATQCMADIREQLYILCVEHLKEREAEIRKAITEAQDAANEEPNNSTGDRFETGREVALQEIELNLARLNELDKFKTMLEQITPAQVEHAVAPGSVIYTNNGNFYMAISAGKLKINDATFYGISAASPIGSKLLGQKAGDQFTFNDKKFVIEKVA